MNKKTASVMAAAILSLGISTAPAAAHGLAQSYGCQINPKAAACQQASKPQVSSGSVSGVASANTSAGGPTSLPTTGGGMPDSPAVNILELLAAVGLSVLGFGIHRRASRRL